MALEKIDDLFLRADHDALWELFHENSKTSFVELHPNFKRWPSDAEIVTNMKLLRRVKPYTDFPKLQLPSKWPASEKSLDQVVTGRQGARSFGGSSIEVEHLAKVLWMSYGINRDNRGTGYPRPFRMVPSGGALYPLEIYVHATRVEGLEPGLYHYDSEEHQFDILNTQDDSTRIAGYFVQKELAMSAAAIIFISAVFSRSIFKYGDRGYRFILLETGHLAQNATLVAQEEGLATTTIGGYLDRDVDRYLGMDGLNESTIYILLLGSPSIPTEPSEDGRDDSENGRQ